MVRTNPFLINDVFNTIGGSSCGYSTEARQKRSSSQSKDQWSRQAPYDFTGCCVHADITYDTSSSNVSRIIGYFEHNEECRNAGLVRYPSIPLHEHVYEVALEQLSQGARYEARSLNGHCCQSNIVFSVTAIQAENVWRVEHRQYRDIGVRLNHRYELLNSDFSRLYRRYYRLQGINVETKPEINVHNWLDNTSSAFNPTIADAVFHYAPRVEVGERFELCISTPEMRSAAIKLIHKRQLILDGTFGLSASRLLLWIAMGVNEENHGVPVALFLFSAPSGAKATHAGYDTSILSKLLGKWNDSFLPGELEPAVAITDTDTKERGALINVWPNITLLLCRFHLWQCWTNKRNSLFGAKNETSFFKEKSLLCIRELDALYVYLVYGKATPTDCYPAFCQIQLVPPL